MAKTVKEINMIIESAKSCVGYITMLENLEAEV